MTLREVIGDYNAFVKEVLRQVEQAGFDLDDFIQIDHICYRTTSLDNYEQKKTELAEIAKLLGETMVNGRPISTFRLSDPIRHSKWRIDAVELPAPKPGQELEEGLEHLEFILFDDIPTFLAKYKDKQFEMKAADRGINPEIGFKLDKCSVKFHLLNLPTVVYLENKLGIHDVRDSQ